MPFVLFNLILGLLAVEFDYRIAGAMNQWGSTLREVKSLQPTRVGGICGGQNLDSHFALQHHIAGAVNLPHASSPERANDFVLVESSAGQNRHICARL